jgi:hypothetical protein
MSCSPLGCSGGVKKGKALIKFQDSHAIPPSSDVRTQKLHTAQRNVTRLLLVVDSTGDQCCISKRNVSSPAQDAQSERDKTTSLLARRTVLLLNDMRGIYET